MNWKENRKVISVVIVILLIAGALGIAGYEYSKDPNRTEGMMININSNVSGIRLNRIVSLDPAVSATLYALGAYRDIVGSTVYVTYPPSNLPNLTCYPQMSVQQILNLSPDAVISFTHYNPSSVQQLLNAGVDYIFLSAGLNSTFADIMQQNLLLGKLTGTEKNATLLNTWMSKSLNAFSNVSVTNKSLLYAMCVENGATWTTGQGTFVNEMFTYAHLNNIANQSNFYQISNEEIVNENPQVILLGSCFNTSDLNKSPFTSTDAYKNNSIYTVFNTNLFSEPNFRNIYAVEWLMYEVYGIKVNLPAFPFNLPYNPEPKAVSDL